MANKKELTAETETMSDIYWTAVNSGGDVEHVCEEIFNGMLKMHGAKLLGMENAMSEMKDKDAELLSTIREKLNNTGGIVDKDITWFYKERSKLLKNKSKLSAKISAEEKKLTELWRKL
jgi:hypothetical protein